MKNIKLEGETGGVVVIGKRKAARLGKH